MDLTSSGLNVELNILSKYDCMHTVYMVVGDIMKEREKKYVPVHAPILALFTRRRESIQQALSFY